MDKKNALKILNLGTKASFEDAKKSYRDLAKKYHPDVVVKNSSLEKDAESKMKDINLAYRYLAPKLRSNKSAGEKKSSKYKQSHQQPHKQSKDHRNTGKKESPEKDVGSMESIGKKIIESFTKAFFKKPTTIKPLRKKNRKEQVVRKRTGKVFFEDVFKQVHKGSIPKTRTKKKKNTGYANKKGPSDYYQRYMILKRKMTSVQSRTNQDLTIQRVEKIDPVRPVNPISKKK
jgi:DnaJ-class molecular chaperone